jgi:hypothetical protein
MERIAALSNGTKLTLASGFLLFFDLFFTWQNLPQRFGTRFDVTATLDGWDRWGLVIGLLALALLTVVVIRETDVELSPYVPWNLATLALASVLLGVTLLKNLTDAHSAWASYAGIVLAALTVVGAYLDRDRIEPEHEHEHEGVGPLTWRPRVRASPEPAPSGRSPARRAPAEPEPQAAEPARRW